jgi:protein-S-isoprenylcysteine O-methyltransferase Ste14
MRTLESRIPPPLVALFTAISMWLLALASPRFAFTLPMHRLLAGGLALCGVLIAVAGVVSFRRARTTLNPMKPERASALVTSGIFRRTRNPMYLGLLFFLTGWALFLANLMAFALLPAFVAYITYFQIRPEELALSSAFGRAFDDYRSAVRRWL